MSISQLFVPKECPYDVWQTTDTNLWSFCEKRRARFGSIILFLIVLIGAIVASLIWKSTTVWIVSGVIVVLAGIYAIVSPLLRGATSTRESERLLTMFEAQRRINPSLTWDTFVNSYMHQLSTRASQRQAGAQSG